MAADRQPQDEAQETVDRVRQVLGHALSRPEMGKGNAGNSADFRSLPEYEMFDLQKRAGARAGIVNPFCRVHDGLASDTTSIAGRPVINFSSSDYIGLNGLPEINEAAIRAISRYGTSVSASRVTAGERPVHRELEAALSKIHRTDDAVVFASGHTTNVSVIGSLLGQEDLIVADFLVHNSVLEGAKLSGAKRILYPHGDLDAIERSLRLNRRRHRRALLIVEGLYGMEGDVPELSALVRLKQRYDAWLMVDEAHSLGVLGENGRGIAEEQGVNPTDIDIWMGTLSKALVATGGYVAGSRTLVDMLKGTSPGFVHSVGLSPSIAATALAAAEVMEREVWRMKKLRENGKTFVSAAKARGLDTGLSIGASIVPVIIGNSSAAVMLSDRLLSRGYNVVPTVFPDVAENQSRLRFFITTRHTATQITGALDVIAEELAAIRGAPALR